MANLTPTQPGQLLPGNGVYAAYARLADGRAVRTAVSVGTNPTTGADGACKVEAFLMDGFAEDVYDQPFALDFRGKVQGEQGFDGLDALVARMGGDVAQVANLLPVS